MESNFSSNGNEESGSSKETNKKSGHTKSKSIVEEKENISHHNRNLSQFEEKSKEKKDYFHKFEIGGMLDFNNKI